MTTATIPSILTANQIPCCLCGTLIYPNAANQCSTCLAQEFNLGNIVQRGPGGSSQITIYQCRKCRRYGRTEKHYEHAEPESSELLSICLKHIPALAATAEPRLHIVDAAWIWTEPHSMRFKVRLTVRTELLQVSVQQRVMVELHCQFKMCPDCNREYTNRTWHALVQLRQFRDVQDGAPKKGLAALEQSIAKSQKVRQHVLRIDTAKNGFDFYFLSPVHAQSFTSFLQRVAPMRVKTTQKLVSQDVQNNTNNMKATTLAQMVPLCRDDLLVIHKAAKAKLSGRLALVHKVSSVVHIIDASPKRENIDDSRMELSVDGYYKNEKHFTILQAAHRLVRFVVLDVELCTPPTEQQPSPIMVDTGEASMMYQGPHSGIEKYALADMQVAREADFGVNDDILTCVTHLGHLIQPGDTVLGYDLVTSNGQGDWELLENFHSNFILPDVVLVKKVQGGKSEPAADVDDESASGARVTKRRQRQRRKREGKRTKELEESALRMGFVPEGYDPDFDAELANDPQMQAELNALEQDLDALQEEGPEYDNTDLYDEIDPGYGDVTGESEESPE